VRQSSFSFEVVKDDWEDRGEEPPHRTLREVRLWEASPVLWGANPAAEVDVKRAVKSYAEYRGVSSDSELGDADTITTIREATTESPAAESPAEALEATSPPEPKRQPTIADTL